jgi:hypothetical protein
MISVRPREITRKASMAIKRRGAAVQITSPRPHVKILRKDLQGERSASVFAVMILTHIIRVITREDGVDPLTLNTFLTPDLSQNAPKRVVGSEGDLQSA